METSSFFFLAEESTIVTSVTNDTGGLINIFFRFGISSPRLLLPVLSEFDAVLVHLFFFVSLSLYRYHRHVISFLALYAPRLYL